MHKFEMPADYVRRVVARQGRAHTCETFDGPKTALVVVDMQNFFMAPGQLAAAPMADDIMPNVNRLAAAVRAAGGLVVWIRNQVLPESVDSWATFHERFVPAESQGRLKEMAPGSFGHALRPGLDVQPQDLIVAKRRYSAFIAGSSGIELVLRDRGIDTLIITGVATNVCCESTARDAMMLNFRTLMVSDGCATVTDQEHADALTSFYLQFGDVQKTDEIIARLQAPAR